jgi:hypothetical protein
LPAGFAQWVNPLARAKDCDESAQVFVQSRQGFPKILLGESQKIKGLRRVKGGNAFSQIFAGLRPPEGGGASIPHDALAGSSRRARGQGGWNCVGMSQRSFRHRRGSKPRAEIDLSEV